MSALRTSAVGLRRAFRFAAALLPLVVVAAILDVGLGGSSVSEGVLDLLVVPAAILAGARVRGTRLGALVLAGAFGLSVSGQLDPSDHYSFFNDFYFFLVVLVGAPALVGVVLRRRIELVGGLSERARRLSGRAGIAGEAAAAGERGRLQRELEAVLTDRVAEIVVQASGAERAMEADPGRAREALAHIETAARSVLDDLRGVLGVLRVGDEDLALRPAASLSQLEQLQAAGILTLEVDGERGPLDPAVDATAFRVAREAVRGAVVDAAAAHVRILYGPRAVRVEIAGGRFPEDGEAGIQHRVRLFGGRCRQNEEMVSLELPRRVPW